MLPMLTPKLLLRSPWTSCMHQLQLAVCSTLRVVNLYDISRLLKQLCCAVQVAFFAVQEAHGVERVRIFVAALAEPLLPSALSTKGSASAVPTFTASASSSYSSSARCSSPLKLSARAKRNAAYKVSLCVFPSVASL